MQKTSLQILFFLIALAGISMLYFLSLILHIPYWILVVLVVAAAFLLFRWMRGLQAPENDPALTKKETAWSCAVFIAGVAILVNKCTYLGEKYGEWDAWSFWNTHAVFLKDPQRWQQLFQTVVPHNDYPLCLQSMVAFFWRLTSGSSYLVPYALSLIVTLLIPTLIFLELYKKNLPLAALILLWFATDDFYLTRGLSQYADHLLAAFFLCSFVCLDHFKETKDGRYLALTGAFLGCCAWTKNEGIILAVVCTLSYTDLILKNRNWLHFVSGLAIPLIVYSLFKTAYAPPNDLVARKDRINSSFLTDGSRYRMILLSFNKTIKADFPFHKILLGAYLLVCVLMRRTDRNVLIILLCVMGYFLIYLLTPMSLEWHLNTSLNRLLLQLSPAFIYIAAGRLAAVKLQLSEE